MKTKDDKQMKQTKRTYTELNTQARDIFLRLGTKPLYEVDGKIYEAAEDGYHLKEYQRKSTKSILERKIIYDGELYVILAEAKKMQSVSDKNIRYQLSKSDSIIRRITKGKRTYYCLQDIIDYFGSGNNPFVALQKQPEESFRYLDKNGFNLLVGSYGTIYHLDTRKVIGNKAPSGNGHQQINVGGILYLQHQIVAEAWLDNKLNKSVLHHINGIKNDNRAENLIYCTPQQHKQAHLLLDNIKSSETDTGKSIAKKEYDDYIKALMLENAER